jgi:hypothetical protein
MKNNITFEKLKDFINIEFLVKKEKIKPHTTLEEDLGITGTDGTDFLEKFLNHFNIKYEENREWQLYFGAEGFGFINFIGVYNWLRGKKDNRIHYDLTIEHLVKVIELGYWIDMKDETK